MLWWFILACRHPERPTVVLFSIDGASADLIDDEWDNLSALPELAESGGHYPAELYGVSDTRAAHARMLTGYPASVTGVYSASDWLQIPPDLSAPERLRDEFEDDLSMAFIAAKPSMIGFEEGETFFHVAAPFDVAENEAFSTAELGGKMRDAVDKLSDRPLFAFFHFAEVDRWGHAHGERSTEQREALRSVDDEIGRVMERFEDRPVTVIVTSDHGFEEGTNTHTSNARDVFMIANLPLSNVISQSQVAWTILDLYGLDPDEYSPAPEHDSMQ